MRHGKYVMYKYPGELSKSLDEVILLGRPKVRKWLLKIPFAVFKF